MFEEKHIKFSPWQRLVNIENKAVHGPTSQLKRCQLFIMFC